MTLVTRNHENSRLASVNMLLSLTYCQSVVKWRENLEIMAIGHILRPMPCALRRGVRLLGTPYG